MNLIERMEATQKTVDQFKRKEFRLGRIDCVQMCLAHAKRCGVKVKIPKYGDARSAVKALRAVDAKHIAQVLDRHFPRIDPHMALMGDFIEMPGGCLNEAGDFPGFTSLAIAIGNGRVIGFHEEIPFADILQPVLISGAWSIG